MPRNSFSTIFDGNDTDWDFGRMSSQTVIDDQGAERTVDPDIRAIYGGIWNGDQFIGGGQGIELVNETTVDDLNLSQTMAGTPLTLPYERLGCRRVKTGMSGQVIYNLRDVPSLGGEVIFGVFAGDMPLVYAVAYPDRVELACENGYRHEHLAPLQPMDMRFRYSAGSGFTTWLNGDKINTPGGAELSRYPGHFLAGGTSYTSGLGSLRYVQWHDTARPFSEIEGWPADV